MSRPEIYADNAAAMMGSLGAATEPWPDVVQVSMSRGIRLILRRETKLDLAEVLDAMPYTKRLTIEDSFSSLIGEAGDHVAVTRMPVMVRPAGPIKESNPATVTVALAEDTDALAEADRITIDGFPIVPNPGGPLMPQSVLQQPEWKVWLAYHDGVAAASAYTYDDGTAAGVYLLATLPQHRNAGLGRAIMTAAVAAYPNRAIALVATEAGVPLYRSLGFTEVSEATWYIREVVD